jgi:signal peptidase II
VNESVATPPATRWYLKFGALRWGSLTLLVILVDQMTKAFVESRFDLFDAVRVLPFLDFTLLYNTGAAFSFLAGASGWQRWFFIALGIVVSVAILAWMRQLDPRRHRLLAAGLALIMGGALGNVIDRVWHGHVIDFIHFHWKQWEFPAFNMADTSITIGAALLILDAILESRRGRGASHSSA